MVRYGAIYLQRKKYNILVRLTAPYIYQLPITHYQLPITHYQLPITNYQLPITNYQVGIGT